MKRELRQLMILAPLLGATVLACGGSNPLKPQNHNPIMLSLDVFPTAIGPNDSAVVICSAFDPDNDTLRYDWITDGTLDIRGQSTGFHFKYNTVANSEVFYHSTTCPDTTLIQCVARDGKGGSVAGIVRIILQ